MQWPASLSFSYLLKSIAKNACYVFSLSADVHKRTTVRLVLPASSSSKLQQYINNSLHLARKYARIFVRGHYLFREAKSFPRAKL